MNIHFLGFFVLFLHIFLSICHEDVAIAFDDDNHIKNLLEKFHNIALVSFNLTELFDETPLKNFNKEWTQNDSRFDFFHVKNRSKIKCSHLYEIHILYNAI